MRVRLEGVSVTYRQAGAKLLALAPLTVDIPSGQFVAILGASGCGKSTLVRVVAGLQPATSGSVWLDEVRNTRPHPAVGMMFQDATLMGWRTVFDNIALPLELAGASHAAREARLRALLPMLGLEAWANAYPAMLSGGMAQRAALGRVLAQNPRLLLLDEPFGALDAFTREQLRLDLLALWRDMRQTVLMVTHDIHEAVFMADRLLVFSPRPGRLVADIAIDLPRPRQLDMVYDAEFGVYARAARAAMV